MTINPELLKQLQEGQVSAEAIAVLEKAGFDTTAVLTVISDSDLKEEGVARLSDRLKIKFIFPLTSSPKVETPRATESESTESISQTSESPKTNTNQYGNFAYLIEGRESSSGVGQLNLRINSSLVERSAQAVMAYVLLSTKLADTFGVDFWSDLKLEDLSLRDKISQWLQSTSSEEYISEEARHSLCAEVPKLFTSTTDLLVERMAKVFREDALGSENANACSKSGSSQFGLESLAQLVCLTAEDVSQKMRQSQMPEQANRLVKMLKVLMEILNDETLHLGFGIHHSNSGDEGLVQLLHRTFDGETVNRIRLALAYEKFIGALAVCPPEGSVEVGYLQALAKLGGDLTNLFLMVRPLCSNTEKPQPFAKMATLAAATAANSSAKASLDVAPIGPNESDLIKLYREKLQFMEAALATQSDPKQQFSTEQVIKDCVTNINKLSGYSQSINQ